ncbi:alpha/beta fold hydrolase [Bradyrhizobium erythrophlei]|uniref:Pimeloyl-ACP methyl ester carboxylesterase n=1 Tax=Bradyrhizobium erythrophlei TaxID=1437360 RepID=A0A1H5A1I5_9BRAD|nr:alpha/beta fold hydrolase [Bradyrhizobium erythrophlei]SED36316.1 Pimeloyl-ACP methyl ester carboxylesterase [Bradyrhizobium erythrophlei]
MRDAPDHMPVSAKVQETAMIHFSCSPDSQAIAERQISINATRRAVLAGSVAAVGVGATASAQASAPHPSMAIKHKWVRADGVDVFYREAGPAEAPTMLLLHGFANSSFYFRHLMPTLADRFRLIAPDLPSFGFTQIAADRNYRYDFESLSRTITAFVDVMELKRYVLYVFDYGAPIGWDLALTYPDRVAGIISQNGNAYTEGLRKEAWDPLRAYWASPSPDKREPIRARMSLDGVKAAYFHGVADPSRIEPEAYTLDAAILARPGNAELQIDLKLDYKRNIERYPLYQDFFRRQQPRLLAVWGKHDPFFAPAGADAFRRDISTARVVLLDTGHFALETEREAIGEEVRRFLMDA